MNKIIKSLSVLMMAFPVIAAAMQTMDDASLSETYGQAIFEVTDQTVEQAGGGSLDMLRLTIGARIEINANIEEIALGRYWRPEGTNCTGGAGGDKICYNDIVPDSYNDNINWACTAKPCGSVGLAESVYAPSSLSNGTSTPFFDFPGGFEPDSGVDIKLRDVTMGQVIKQTDSNGQAVYELTPFIQENPYLEFAFDNVGGAKQLVGFRLGAEDSYGYQGNIIDVISGFIRPTITANVAGLANIHLEAFLGGVRTVGWLDASNLVIYDIEDTSGLGFIVDLLAGDPQKLVNQSPNPQLFPVQTNYLNHTKGFFISMGTRSIQWSPVQGFSPEVTEPGFWLNMGGDGGLIANTRYTNHPNNYFPTHDKFNTYGSLPNYGDTTTRPSWSQTYTAN